MTLTDHDHTMIALAAKRALVEVTTTTGTTTARLLAWRPSKVSRGREKRSTRRNVARVVYASGRSASVPVDAVRPIDGAA